MTKATRTAGGRRHTVIAVIGILAAVLLMLAVHLGLGGALLTASPWAAAVLAAAVLLKLLLFFLGGRKLHRVRSRHKD